MNNIASVLCVDDDPDILSALKRQLHGKYKVLTAEDGEQGLGVIKQNKDISVVISDMRMPKMNGATFLSHVKDYSPHTVRILLTGQSDMESAIDAINHGQIFRFLMKPCEQNELFEILDTAVKEYQLVSLEDDLLKKTIYGSASLIDMILHSVHPMAHRYATRIQAYVSFMVEGLDLSNKQQYLSAASLSMLGCLNMPSEIIEKLIQHKELDQHEAMLYMKHLEAGWNLLGKVAKLKQINQVMQTIKAGYANPEQMSINIETDFIHIAAAQLIKIAIDLDQSIAIYGGIEDALAEMQEHNAYDASVLDLLKNFDISSTAH